MDRLFIVVAGILLLAGSALAGQPSGDMAARITGLGGRIDTMAKGKVGEYARETLDAARSASLAAQGAFTGGNDAVALQKLELAEMQLLVAEAKAAEKELAEETAVRRAEVKRLEAQLERYVQGEDQ